MTFLAKLHNKVTAKLSSKAFKNVRFSRKQLTIYGTIFAAIGGTLFYIALAAPTTKTWDSQADFDATGNTKQNITTNADGTFGLTPSGGGGTFTGNPMWQITFENTELDGTPETGGAHRDPNHNVNDIVRFSS